MNRVKFLEQRIPVPILPADARQSDLMSGRRQGDRRIGPAAFKTVPRPPPIEMSARAQRSRQRDR